jgi:hypothetical protein
MDAQLQGVVDYIKQCLAGGASENAIWSQLIDGGWPEDLVTRGFELYHHPEVSAPTEAIPTLAQQLEEPAAQPGSPHPLSSIPIKKRGIKRFLTKKIMAIVGIVLTVAILGPILVSLASKPALKTRSENTAHTNDASAIWSAAETYAGSHKGVWPSSAVPDSAGNTINICGSVCDSGNKVSVKLSTTNVAAISFKAYSTDLKVPDSSTIYLVTDALCKSDKSGIGDSTKGQKFAFITVLYAVKSGGSIKQQCVS